MRNKIEDLRNHMFAAIERLAEAESPEEIAKELERSKGIADLGKVIVESAKAEVEFVKSVGVGDGRIPQFFTQEEVKKLN